MPPLPAAAGAGSLSEREAFLAAVKTWPEGVRPVVHWSESQPGRRPHAHSDYVRVRPLLLPPLLLPARVATPGIDFGIFFTFCCCSCN